MQLNERTRWYLRLQNVIFFVLVMVLLGAVAWLGERYSTEFDWTANKRNSLTEESAALLRTLEGPIQITAYASDNEMLRTAIRSLIRRYQRVKPDVLLNFVNPDLAPEQARAEGIRFDGTLIVNYQGRREQLSAPTERELSNALARLARGGEVWTVFLTGHGERKHDGGANFDLATLGQELEQQGFALQSLNLAASPLPDNTALVVIASPRSELLPGEWQRLQDYLDDGGNLLWLTDPDNVAQLDELQNWLGLRVQKGVVVDPTTQVFGVNDPTIALVMDYPARGPTADFQLLTLFPRAAGLSFENDDSDWTAMAILRTAPNSWLERGELAGNVTLDAEDEAGPITIAYALERYVDNADEERRQRIVVVGDGDFASNAFVGNQGNLDLAVNLFNWSASQDSLLNIRIRAIPDASLTLGRTTQLLLGVGFLFGLPLLLFAAGVVVFLRRRRR